MNDMNQEIENENEKLKLGTLIQLTLKLNAIEQLLIKKSIISESEVTEVINENYSKFKNQLEKSLNLK